jgi:hypothetical protein
MNFARTILALLTAVSLALLPAAGHAGVAVKSTDMSAMSDMAAMDEMAAMDDMACCPHKSHPADKAMDDCASMVGCILCFGFSGPVFSDIVFPPLLTSVAIAFASTPFHSQTGSPPFRPPRV